MAFWLALAGMVAPLGYLAWMMWLAFTRPPLIRDAAIAEDPGLSSDDKYRRLPRRGVVGESVPDAD